MSLTLLILKTSALVDLKKTKLTSVNVIVHVVKC